MRPHRRASDRDEWLCHRPRPGSSTRCADAEVLHRDLAGWRRDTRSEREADRTIERTGVRPRSDRHLAEEIDLTLDLDTATLRRVALGLPVER